MYFIHPLITVISILRCEIHLLSMTSPLQQLKATSSVMICDSGKSMSLKYIIWRNAYTRALIMSGTTETGLAIPEQARSEILHR